LTILSDNSEAGLANQALSLAEVRSTISSLDQPNSKAARVCRLHFAQVRDAVLRTYGFSFSTSWRSVAALPDAPAGGVFSTAFDLPEDFLRMIKVDGLSKRSWTLAEGRLLATATGSLTIGYVKLVADFTLWEPLARNLFITQLAIRVAPELTHLRGIRQQLQLDLQKLELEATKIDAYESDSAEDETDHAAWVPEYIRVRAC
jgi:hypothetical protein